ncbi:MAG: hypothetical protein HYS87_01080 [Candidatus Colwellbacteria bacterium]|nr:hypothetical protein [Candidatus Colwellbacteria bacterium]
MREKIKFPTEGENKKEEEIKINPKNPEDKKLMENADKLIKEAEAEQEVLNEILELDPKTRVDDAESLVTERWAKGLYKQLGGNVKDFSWENFKKTWKKVKKEAPERRKVLADLRKNVDETSWKSYT